MRVAAFDAKPFERGRTAGGSRGQGDDRGRPRGFSTQLGAGVVISDKDAFRERFAAKFAELRDSIGIGGQVPFCPSSHLLRQGEAEKAVALSEKLVGSVQDLIEGVHFFYVILPPSEPDTVRVGGSACPSRQVPTWLFIKNLGPMFSYLTAEDYLYQNSDAGTDGIEFHIDGFVSKQTRAWKNLVGKVDPMVFWRGDECNPFIACADLVAFLTDVKLRRKHLPLNRDSIADVWSGHSFRTAAHYASRDGITIQAWYNEEIIHVWPYVARPTVFLAMDDTVRDRGASTADDRGSAGPGPAAAPGGQGISRPRPSKFLTKTPVYTAAVRYAFNHSASLKIFDRNEDAGNVRDRDVYVYMGPESKRVGRVLLDMVDVDVMSGRELRNKV